MQREISQKTACPKSWVSALFRRFQARWGHRWTSAIEGIEEIAVDEWAAGLAGVTGEQIQAGMAVAGEEPWPPSLPEFRQACTGARRPENEFGLNYVPEYHRAPARTLDKSRLLSSTSRDERRKLAGRNISKLRNAIAGKHTTED